MARIDFRRAYLRRGNVIDPTEFDQDGYPLWISSNEDGPLRMIDMSDQHLMNSISFVVRKFEEWQQDSIRIMQTNLTRLGLELGQYYLNNDVADIEETVLEEWCPRVRYLRMEVRSRGLH
ncbi:hypothetical protein LCGC14_1644160 [marine sediment metagenome]|uniref:Uncharacterized protein n=1 Tax=marine sediment metagenome TaxID=412755 RepID=A0A0F9KYK6_9ZZZZ